jgi:hypothetical protein
VQPYRKDTFYRETIGSPAQDTELMAEHHDLQLLEVARPTAEQDDLEDAAQHDVSRRDEHEASGA